MTSGAHFKKRELKGRKDSSKSKRVKIKILDGQHYWRKESNSEDRLFLKKNSQMISHFHF